MAQSCHLHLQVFFFFFFKLQCKINRCPLELVKVVPKKYAVLEVLKDKGSRRKHCSVFMKAVSPLHPLKSTTENLCWELLKI